MCEEHALYGAGNMPRDNWLLLILALFGVGGGVALWIARAAEAAHLVWTAATVVAFVPLVVRVSKSLLRREPGVDIIAVFAMAGAPSRPPVARRRSDDGRRR